MIPITRVICIYASKAQAWAVELTLDGDGPSKTRLTLRGPEHMETFLDAFDDCDQALFDPASGEVRFVFDGDDVDEEDEDDDEEEEEGKDEDEDSEDADAAEADDACEVAERPGENDGGFAGEITTKDSP
jgi:hypothetical protein